jgi:hypothetical protein
MGVECSHQDGQVIVNARLRVILPQNLGCTFSFIFGGGIRPAPRVSNFALAMHALQDTY